MHENKIEVHEFSVEKVLDLICSGTDDKEIFIPHQVQYLAHYCASLGAQTIVYESFYVDRHYLDEYALYYSRMLSAPNSYVSRIHFFATKFDEAKFSELLARSFLSEKDRRSVEDELMQVPGSKLPGYLGCSTIRPIKTVPVGRTILAKLADESPPEREILTTCTHNVHLANLHLRVEGLAFQQQDAAVGACATAALWSALVRVARQDGMRAPTPAEITDAATISSRAGLRHMLSVNTGLSIYELCQATRLLGFTPEVISASGRPEILAIALHTYLLSGIPVVLALKEGDGPGHAVTAVGYQMFTTEHKGLKSTIPVRSSRLHKIYVHDDRIGPYARAYIEPGKIPIFNELLEASVVDGLNFEIERRGEENEIVTQRFFLEYAIAPVYPKLRLHVDSLITLAEYLCGGMENAVGRKRAKDLRVDFRYEKAGEYLGKLSGRVYDKAGAPNFVRGVVLSRWCAVIRWYLGEKQLAEFIYDTTDLVRGRMVETPEWLAVSTQNKELLRGVVWLDEEFFEKSGVFGEEFGVRYV